MHSRLCNRAVLDLSIKPQGPLLVRAGHAASDASLPIEHNVQTPHGASPSAPYIPGSSLKGVMRNHFERVARSCGLTACDPFSASSCARRALANSSAQISDAKLYSEVLCAACKVFGCEAAAGRFSVSDAMPSDDNPPKRQLRATLPVDRFLGSGRSATVKDFEPVVGGEFRTRIVLENFELWHLAMIGIVLMDVDDGRVQIGGLRSKGYGLVSVGFNRCEFFFAKPDLPTNGVYGIGTLVSDHQRREFGYMSDDWLLLRMPQRSEPEPDASARPSVQYDVVSDLFGLKYVLSSPDAIKLLLSMLTKNLLDYVSRHLTGEKADDETLG